MLSPWVFRLLVFAAFQFHLAFAILVDRSNSFAVLGSFAGLWLIFLIQWADQNISVKKIVAIGILLRSCYLLAFPELSDDFWRYMWDGLISSEGYSPYFSTPTDWLTWMGPSPYDELYPFLNSPDYYSIYPPVLQFIFKVAATISGSDPYHFVVVLRSIILAAELGSMILIWKLLNAWNLKGRNLMLYAFNPLVIVEFAGNLHGEVFMIFFVLLSLWLLTEKRQFLSAVAFGFSVGAKLLPLMFLPFFIKRLGWIKTAVFGSLVTITVAALYAPHWSIELVQNTRETLALYFAHFEFNGSIYYLIREIGFWYKGYNIIGSTGVWLPRIVLLTILAIAFYNKDKSIKGLPKLMMLAWFIYYALATTVNPWYVAVLAAFLPFTKYRFALLWLILVPLSYHAFGNISYQENLWIIGLEYVPVYSWFLFEVGALKPMEKWWALKRAEVKRLRLLPYLNKGEKVLELGSGNGALSVLLQREDVEVDLLDIEDKSIFKEVDVMVYDGGKFPFLDKQFDVCQLITMLHHTTNAEELIQEAKRVSRKVIVMEDIYESSFQKYITWFTDSLVNWEFYGHPHTNRTDAEWRQLFQENGLEVKEAEYYRFLLFFKQVTYVLVAKP